MLSKERQEQVVELCQKLIRQQSYSGHEDGVVAELSAQMKAEGFDSVTVDRYGNIIGCIKGNRPGKKILFDGHIDTVPVGDETEWTYPPFAADLRPRDQRYERRGGRLCNSGCGICRGHW